MQCNNYPHWAQLFLRTHIHFSLARKGTDFEKAAGPPKKKWMHVLSLKVASTRESDIILSSFGFVSELSAVLICPGVPERQALCSKGFKQVWSFNLLSLEKKKSRWHSNQPAGFCSKEQDCY